MKMTEEQIAARLAEVDAMEARVMAATNKEDAIGAEITRLMNERDEDRAENDRLRAELATARATINGSPDAPTDAELAAHRGAWLARLYSGAFVTMSPIAVRTLRSKGVCELAVRWWALNQNERFCPRPVVTTVSAALDAGPRDADGREVTP